MDDVNFEQFKSVIRSCEENEKAKLQQCECDNFFFFFFTQRCNLKCYARDKDGHRRFHSNQKGNKSGEVRRYDSPDRKPNDGRWCRN